MPVRVAGLSFVDSISALTHILPSTPLRPHLGALCFDHSKAVVLAVHDVVKKNIYVPF